MPPTLHPIRASPPPIVRPGGENHIRSDLSAGEKFNGLLVGKPYAGNRHVRFDERGWETGRCRMSQATAPILDSTRGRRHHSISLGAKNGSGPLDDFSGYSGRILDELLQLFA